MQTLYEEPYFYSVSRDEKTNEYFLDVTCGRVAIFNVQIKLTNREVEQFLADNKSLGVLASRVMNSPEEFIKRTV
ncbi:MAG: hypothetical protein M3209_10665 [Acidobacteriota bacterium]|nr:hypothetical protein [Acidobacteriota bacterium]